MIGIPSFCAWALLFSPLIASALIAVFGIHRRAFSATVAVGGLLVPLACAAWLFIQVLHHHIALPLEYAVPWISLPGLHASFGVLIDRLSLLMSLVVTGVGSAIFLYSLGYMAEDSGYSRYFALLSLFAFSMLTIVLAGNWIQLFIGWELVGFCSYALIGHWYEHPQAAEAGKKAFLVNRVADVGFLLGILALWAISSPIVSERTVAFQMLETRLSILRSIGWVSPEMLVGIALLIFCGVLGKSAQMPLHVWLPDAMEGPTSVSALIHAATMVAAGVYLLCRTFWLFAELSLVLQVIAWVGGATAFFTACLALVESDLKRILAYSTLSQLGYMVMALGLGGPIAGMYHLTTHAFFKALLFLTAGSVIHGTHRQNIWELGGLWRSMPLTSLSFLIGSLALCGFPLLSGFFSKDEILVLAREHNLGLFWVGIITAGLTAFYTTRAGVVTFLGRASSSLHTHESPPTMLGPLVLLSFLSILGGYLGIPAFLGAHSSGGLHLEVVGFSLAAITAGAGMAWFIYARQRRVAKELAGRFSRLYTLLARRYYVDETYNWYVDRVQQRLFARTCALFERLVIINFAVNGTARVTQTTGRVLRYCQTGKVQSYVLVFFIGIVVLLVLAARA